MSIKESTAILVRVSSKSQEDEGYSLDSQLATPKLLSDEWLEGGENILNCRDGIKRLKSKGI